tara:strand:- start:2748 stop:3188 length:441 start_codon:yes stop_codon:yes gene_type:complete
MENEIIHSELYGTWELERFWFTSKDRSETDPLSTYPVGNLIFVNDGHYSFTMMRPGRMMYKDGDLLGGTAKETQEAAGGYVSFGGGWTLQNNIIIFKISYSLFPNWVGKEQKRIAKFENKSLFLRTTIPLQVAGKLHWGAARWNKL